MSTFHPKISVFHVFLLINMDLIFYLIHYKDSWIIGLCKLTGILIKVKSSGDFGLVSRFETISNLENEHTLSNLLQFFQFHYLLIFGFRYINFEL